MNYALASHESLRLSGASRPTCGIAANLAEQPSRGSLTSELADSLALGYLRRRTLRVLRRREENLDFGAKGKKERFEAASRPS